MGMLDDGGTARVRSARELIAVSPVKERTFDQVARLLAGLSAVDERDSLRSFRRLKTWKDHSGEIDRAYSSFEARFAEPFIDWAGTNVTGHRAINAVFYPFSGPDLIFPRLLYPNAKVYVLCGLEPCAPSLVSFSVNKPLLLDSLSDLRTAMTHFFSYSFFTTKEMREHFQHLYVPGVLLILLTLLALSGLRVLSVKFITLGAETHSVHGLRIEFVCRGETRQLFYFQQDLRDGYFGEQSPLLDFVAGLGRFGVLLKSASFLLHESNFSNIRDLILQRCSALVQDPSGIPYRAFDARDWQLSLHGRYTEALAIFRHYEQPELAKAFNAAGAQPELGFGFGYCHREHGGGLIVALPCSPS